MKKGCCLMDIRTLQYFLAVAREQNITTAAEILHMTQPPLSRQMKELEEELGKQLFIRGSRRLILTEEGMLLRKRAEEMITLLEKTKAEISLNDEQLSGEITIGCAETEAMRIIAKAARLLQEKHPRIIINMFSGNAQLVKEKLDNGLVDFGLLLEPTDLTKYDFFKLKSTDTWGIIIRKDDALTQEKAVTAKHLLNRKIIISDQELVDNELSGWLGPDFKKLQIVAKYNLLYNASLMVEEGVGTALSLDRIIGNGINGNLCFRPLEPALMISSCFAWKKQQLLNKPCELFLETLQTLLNQDIS